MKRLLNIIIILFLSTSLKSQDYKYLRLFETIEDSIFTEYPSDIFIKPTVDYKVDNLDFFNKNIPCGIPMKLMIEFFTNGERTPVFVDISKLIDSKNSNSNLRFSLSISDIVSYGNFWFCRLTLWDDKLTDKHYSYSLIYIDKELYCFEKNVWVN